VFYAFRCKRERAILSKKHKIAGVVCKIQEKYWLFHALTISLAVKYFFGPVFWEKSSVKRWLICFAKSQQWRRGGAFYC
jgi:hypothetical protein